jgi:predicted phosphohydrolase
MMDQPTEPKELAIFLDESVYFEQDDYNIWINLVNEQDINQLAEDLGWQEAGMADPMVPS